MIRKRATRWRAGAGIAATALLLSGLVRLAGAPSASAATTAGCGKSAGLSSGTRTITSSGKSRSYILRIPDGYDGNRAYKLIFGLHWLNGSAANVDSANFYGVRSLANNTAIFVAPQGFNAGWANSNGEDVTFIDDIRTQVENALCVDTTQRFAMGFSYGGAMSFALACARPTVFRAVAVFSGAQLSGCAGGTTPVAYLGIHGTTDSVLNISNGRGLRDKFVGLNGCTPQSPREPGAGQAQIKTQYSGCRSGYPVTWIAFSGDHYTPSWVGNEAWSFFTSLPSTTSPTTTTTTTSRTTTTTTSAPTTTTTTTTSTEPTRTTTTSTTSSTTSTVSSAGCAATYRTIGSWPGGYQGEVTVSAGSASLNGWTARWSLGSGQGISQLWAGELSLSGSSVTVRNVSWNASVAAGSSTSFGFIGSGSPSTPAISCTAS